MQTEARERPTAELLKEFSDQATALLRKEIALAKVEVAEKGKKAAVGAGMFGGTGVFGLYAFGALTACAILALATAVAAWLAALIVGVVYGAIAGVLALRGKAQVERDGDRTGCRLDEGGPGMGEDQGQERTQLADDQDKSAAQLRAEIEDVREDLGDTAAALTAKPTMQGAGARAGRRGQAQRDDQEGRAAVQGRRLFARPGGRRRSPSGGASERATSAITQLQTTARANPVPTAALGALIGGFLLGRLTGRGE